MSGRDRTRRFVLAAAAVLGQRSAQIATSLVLFPLVLHTLGEARFAVWAAVTSLIMLAGLADFGLGPAIMTLVPRALAVGDTTRARDCLGAALTLGCALGALFAGLGSAAALCVAAPGEAPSYLIAIAAIAINVPLGTASSTWIALQRGWMVGLWELVQTVLLLCGLAAAVALTLDVRAYVAAFYAALVVANSANLASLLVRRPEIRPARLPPIGALRDMLHTGSQYFALTLLDALTFALDNVIALELLGSAASVQMAVAQRLCSAAAGLLQMMVQPLWSAFAEAAARDDRDWIARTLFRTTAWVAAAAIAGSAILVAFGHPLLRLWLGTDVGISQGFLWVMALWIVTQSVMRVQILLLNALRVVRLQIIVFGIATAMALALKVVLALIYGPMGILLATAVALPSVVIPLMALRRSKSLTRNSARA